ncbi:IclR family transcriptional regulator [Halegenticoccus tardaugens]|uniref:IclR family transcriptional regulator n=1 Tax=Halegenticoccus tardaugens TaxID=2071624 RepID=UPI00100A7719|nr:IclR family transcriptional regulator [Halegenticoccus tardaugens]
MARQGKSKKLQTTATSIEILKFLEEVNGARVSEIADNMEMPKSTVHGHLSTLKAEQFVTQKADFYDLGPELLRLGYQVWTREKGYVLAREFTERLFDVVGLRSVFAAEMSGKAVFIQTASGKKTGWMHERPGNRLSLHNTAVGKAILAKMPRTRVEQIIDKWGLPKETENTITDKEALYAELEAVRKQGYAVNHAENFKELHGIGVAATEKTGNVVGAFSVTGPEHSFSGPDTEASIADAVIEIVDEYELELALA